MNQKGVWKQFGRRVAPEGLTSVRLLTQGFRPGLDYSAPGRYCLGLPVRWFAELKICSTVRAQKLASEA
jgi:hypothetical protein